MTPSSSLAMQQYSIEPRTRNNTKRYEFLSFEKKYKNNYWIQD